MQVKYTLVRPNTEVEFIDVSLPGFKEYAIAIRRAGFDYQNFISDDQLTMISIYTMDESRLIEYDEILAGYADVRTADRERRESLGITLVKEIIP